MDDSALTPAFTDLLLNEILAGSPVVLKAGAELTAEKHKPGHVFCAITSEGTPNDVKGIDMGKDSVLVRIPSKSPLLHALGADPRSQYDNIDFPLQMEFGVYPEEDYMLMGVYPVQALGLINGPADHFVFTIEQDKFHDIAMYMLRKLADPETGAELTHCRDEQTYRQQLRFDQSKASALIGQIARNARLDSHDLAALEDEGRRKLNVEFRDRVAAIARRSTPSFADRHRERGKGGAELGA